MTTLVSTDQNTEEGRYCPKCSGDWRATRIPQESIDRGFYGPPTTEPRYFSHLIGIEDGRYDGTCQWMCPFCGTRWDRWTQEEIQ